MEHVKNITANADNATSKDNPVKIVGVPTSRERRRAQALNENLLRRKQQKYAKRESLTSY